MPFVHAIGNSPEQPRKEPNTPKPITELQKMAELRTTPANEEEAIARWKREELLAKAINEAIGHDDALARLDKVLALWKS